jgi:hypothetical protein
MQARELEPTPPPSPLAAVLMQLKTGELETVDEACQEVWLKLEAVLPAPEEADPAWLDSDYDVGYLDGVNDARDALRYLLAQFCGIHERG